MNSFVFTFPAQAVTNSPENKSGQEAKGKHDAKTTAQDDEDDKKIASVLTSTAELLKQSNRTDALISSAIGSTSSIATSEVQQWLQQFGTAKVNATLDRKMALNNASVDLLVPLYDNKKQDLLFTQVGARRNDDRDIVNIGIGYRYFADHWMWGVNTFYDQQLSGNKHQRLGVGTELGSDFFRLSANGYRRLSGWKNSKRYADYQERVANGYDIRAEGYLPVYPQLGAELAWEQYFGEEVALSQNSSDKRLSNPWAMTLGVNYTPFPLMTVGLNQKMGKGDQNDTQVNLNLNWKMGESLASHLDPDAVGASRTLMGSRYELVNRNNDIVLEYRKQQVIWLTLQDKISGTESMTLPVNVQVKSKYPLDHIHWQADSLLKNGGNISEKNGAWSVTLPHYHTGNAVKNVYVVSATALDTKGNQSPPAYMTVQVDSFNIQHAVTTASAAKMTLPADGVSSTPISVTLTTASGEKITGQAANLSAQITEANSKQQKPQKKARLQKKTSLSPATAPTQVPASISAFKENSPGVYVTTFHAGNMPGQTTVDVFYNKTQKISSTTITLESPAASERFAAHGITASATSALANGTDAISLTAHIVDATGNPVSGVPVTWTTDNAQALLSATSARTDAQGNASISLTSSQLLSTTISAHLDNGEIIKSEALQFIADNANAVISQIDGDKTGAIANGQDTIILQAIVTDTSNHPLSNQTVNWAISSGSTTAHLAGSQSQTNENGVATMLLTSTSAGQVTVSATTGDKTTGKAVPKHSVPLTFAADAKSAVLKNITPDKTTLLADGKESATLTVIAEDALGNPLKNVQIDWSTLSTTAHFAPTTALTDDEGKATTQVSSSAVEDVALTAALQGQKMTSPTLHFTVDNKSAAVTSLNTSKETAVANLNDAIQLTALICDAHQHPVSGSPVKWTITSGKGVLSTEQNTTDASGYSKVMLTSASSGDVVVTASTASGSAVASHNLHFIADSTSAKVTDVTVDKKHAVADGKESVTYIATVKDEKGNALANHKVTWHASGAGVILSAATTQTDASGVASVTLSALKAGTVSLSAQAEAGVAFNASPVTFTGDTRTAQLTDLKISKQNALANGTDEVTFTGTVMDANSNPLSGISINWSATPATGHLSAASGTSDSNGNVTVSLTSKQRGAHQVTALVNGKSVTSNSVTFTEDAATASLSALNADKTSITAGTGSVTLTTQVLDASGHPVANKSVVWKSDNAAGVFSETTSNTDAQGNAKVTYSSTRAQATTITASGDNNSQKTVKLTITPDVKSAKPVDVTVNKTSATANGKDLVTLTATVEDQYKNPVSQHDINWQIQPAGKYHLTGSPQKTDDRGRVTATLASEDVVACQAVATANGVNKSSATINFSADAATTRVSALTSSTTADVVAGKDVITLLSVVTDSNGHPVAKQIVYWSSDNTTGDFIPADASETNSQGIAEIKYKATRSGATHITASTNQTSRDIAVNIIGDMATAILSDSKVDKTQAVADGNEPMTWSVTVKDANGNTLPGALVNWNSSDPKLIFVSTSSLADNQGVATMHFTSTHAGQTTVSATTANGAAKQTTTLTFVADAKSAVLKSISPDKTTLLADGKDSATLTAVAEDAQGNPLKNVQIDWSSTSNTAQLSASTTQTDEQGHVTVQVSSPAVEEVTLTATLQGQKLASPVLHFMADSKTAAVTSLNADKKTAIANLNDAIQLTALVTDASKHPVIGSQVKWVITSGKGTLSNAQNTTDASGNSLVTLTSQSSGDVVVTASTASGSAVSSQSLHFTADSTSAKVTDVTVDKTQAIADGKELITYTAAVKDAKGNPVTNHKVTWSASGTGVTLSAPSTTTSASGVASVTLSALKAGNAGVTAQAETGAGFNAPQVTFIGDARTAQLTDLKLSKQNALANGADEVFFTGIVTDANSNPLSGISINWAAIPATGLLSTASSTSDSNGNVTVSLTSKQRGEHQISGNIGHAASGALVTSGTVKFTEDATSATLQSLTADNTSVTAGKGIVTLTAQVLDASGHPVANKPVVWQSDNAAGVFSETTSNTDAKGNVKVTYISTLAKATTITASSDNHSQKTIQLTITPDIQSAKPVNVSASKTSAMANNKDVVTLTATVEDEYKNPVSQSEVTWQVQPATGKYHLTGSPQKTDAQGQVTATLTSEDVLACQAVATINGVSQSSETISFGADAATAAVSALTPSTTTDVAAGDNITLKATVTDEAGHPVINQRVNWSSDNTNGIFQPGNVTDTNSQGIAEVAYSTTKGGASQITAGINQSSQTVTVNVTGNIATAALSDSKVDKTQAVADDKELVTWSVTVKDAHDNPVKGVQIDWTSNAPNLTLDGTNSLTDNQGVATVSGHTKIAAVTIVTATIPVNGTQLAAPGVTFIGDIKTAKMDTIYSNKSIVAPDGKDNATYEAIVTDINNNRVPDATVSWQTTPGFFLSAETSKTDANGITSVTIRSTKVGMATTTASTNGSTITDPDMAFMTEISEHWVINTDTAQTMSAHLSAPNLYTAFIVAPPTMGPTTLSSGNNPDNEVIQTPIIDEHGKEYTLKLRARKLTACGLYSFNTVIGCGLSLARSLFDWSRSDNPDLPAGHYTGLIHYILTDGTWKFEYNMTVDLTIN
ncbi:Ig-like domain-containing protein [Escherichia sp. E1130]|uniref:Ig-like domain-containing protein n=3 Tax=unclassified Escherichia TaxID=2608889 RepID=UPI0014855E61|nr:Ig-like domain-containing protein [Escherichia sp. E1130]